MKLPITLHWYNYKNWYWRLLVKIKLVKPYIIYSNNKKVPYWYMSKEDRESELNFLVGIKGVIPFSNNSKINEIRDIINEI